MYHVYNMFMYMFITINMYYKHKQVIHKHVLINTCEYAHAYVFIYV